VTGALGCEEVRGRRGAGLHLIMDNVQQSVPALTGA
jgi:hypothetical protein